jgi:hypothetical protein
MATPSLYRALPSDRRLALVTHLITTRQDMRARFIARIVARGGGFRAATLTRWPLAQLAREVVRLNAQTPDDEVDLLQALYVEVEPGIQVSFLDAAGVAHENGVIADSVKPPYASEAAVAKAAAALRAEFGDQGEHYLRTIARYNGAAWPGLDALL